LFKWAQPEIDAYLEWVVRAADHSGGGILNEVPRTVRDCPDHEDNLILDLAAEVGALIMVSNDTDFLPMSPWREDRSSSRPHSRPRYTPCVGTPGDDGISGDAEVTRDRQPLPGRRPG